MKHPKLVRALVAANVLLLAAAAIVIARPTLVPNAFAQTEAARPRGQYTMVSGKTNQGGPHAVYILDAASREVIALRWDQSRQSLVGVGYRIRRYDTPRRAVYSKVYNLLMRVLFGVRVRDVNFSFKLVSRKVLDHIRLSAATVFIDGQLLAEAKRHGFVVAELPIDYRPRKVGSSSFNSLRAAWDTLVEMLRHRFAPSSLPEPVPLQVIGAESTERIASSSPDLEAAAGTTAEGLDDLGASVLSQAETSQDPLRKVSAANLS